MVVVDLVLLLVIGEDILLLLEAELSFSCFCSFLFIFLFFLDPVLKSESEQFDSLISLSGSHCTPDSAELKFSLLSLPESDERGGILAEISEFVSLLKTITASLPKATPGFF